MSGNSDRDSTGIPSPEIRRVDTGGDERIPLIRRIRRMVEVLRGSSVEVEQYDPERHGRLVTFDGLGGFREVERYWVNAPFAFVSINENPRENTHVYYVVEPELDGTEYELLEALFEEIRDPLVYREDLSLADIEETLRTALTDYLERYGVQIDPRTFHKLFYYLYRSFRGYGKLDPIMHDPYVEDISCDGYDLPIFVYHEGYTDIETNVSFARGELDDFVVRLAQHSGRHISIGEPVTETTLPDGSRAELALGEEVTPRGSAFTVRKYSDEPFTPVDLLDYGTFDLDQMAYLWLAIENNRSLIFAGGTASGKTTSMNAISMFIPPRSKVLTIEDTRELSLYHDNWLSSVTREQVHEGKDITMYDLLRSALRHRPEYIIVGEVRGDEAITLFQAMNTGHTTYSTMHADSVQTVINRLENNPINVPRAMVQSLDILCIQTLARQGDRRVRRADRIVEIGSISERTGDLNYSDLYSWDPQSDTVDGRYTDSNVLDEIAEENGWSDREFREEFRDRERVIQYMVDNDISRYDRFTAVVKRYARDPDAVLEGIEDGAEIGDAVEPPAGD